MALIDALIERNAPGLGLLTDPAGRFFATGSRTAGGRWRAWAASERARRHHELAACREWLDTAAGMPAPEQPSELWLAEMTVTSGRLERAEHEPGAAFAALSRGWRLWLGVLDAFYRGAADPRQAVVGRWVRDMVDALADADDQLDPGSPRVLVTWMSERMIHQLHEVGCETIELAGATGRIDVAENVAGRLLDLLPTLTEPPSRLLLMSRVRLDLGNALQAVDRTQDAVVAFGAAIDDLAPIKGTGDVDVRIARLEYNRGNGLLRLGRATEAMALYDDAIETFHRHGMREPELRVRYAKQFALDHRG